MPSTIKRTWQHPILVNQSSFRGPHNKPFFNTLFSLTSHHFPFLTKIANMKSLFLIFCLQVVLVAISTPTSFCRIHPNDENLIQQVCKNTPNYNLCIKYLKSDPSSSTADIRGLSLIMVRAIDSNAKQTLAKINQLVKGSPQKGALSQCADQYKAIISADVPSATQALRTGNPKFAETGVADAAVEADGCERGFSGNSPLTQQNRAMSDIANVARAIIRNLL